MVLDIPESPEDIAIVLKQPRHLPFGLQARLFKGKPCNSSQITMRHGSILSGPPCNDKLWKPSETTSLRMEERSTELLDTLLDLFCPRRTIILNGKVGPFSVAISRLNIQEGFFSLERDYYFIQYELSRFRICVSPKAKMEHMNDYLSSVRYIKDTKKILCTTVGQQK